MAKIVIKDNSTTDPVVSPTQAQMDDWTNKELAEAPADNMLADETPTTIFKDDSDKSID